LRQHAATERVRRELRAAEVESATLMGQLVWDASQRRDHRTAVAYFDAAIEAARQTRDIVAEAHAELRKAYVALYGTGNPAVGLAPHPRAARAMDQHSHVTAGWPMFHAGEPHAMLGDARLCDEALSAAERHFAKIAADAPAGVLFDASQHGRLAGSCWLFL